MMGVCDGHGIHGHLVSNFVKINLPKILQDLIHNKKGANGYKDEYGSAKKAGMSQKGKSSKLQSFLPPLGKKLGKRLNHFEIDGSHLMTGDDPMNFNSESEFGTSSLLADQWLFNENSKVRDSQITDAFKKTEIKMENKSRIDAMFSGTTCVMTFFNKELIVCANAGDSRAILVSE